LKPFGLPIVPNLLGYEPIAVAHLVRLTDALHLRQIRQTLNLDESNP
jgi:hypothetical protein